MVMAKLTLTDESSGFQTTTQRNANYTAIETALENTLSRDGTSPNAMGANLDMNSYRIINLPAPIANSDAARWVDVASAVGLSTAVPNQTGNGGRVLTTDGTAMTWKNAPVAVDTVADMKALTGLVNGAYVYCGGYYAKGDAGAGTFYYNSASAATADNGKYITPNTMAGRFVRIITDMFTPQMFGAKADGSTDDTVAIQAACNACNPGFANTGSTGQFSVNYVFFPAGVYRTTATVTIYGGHTLTGERAAFKPDAGVTVFTVSSTYQNRFDNLIFTGGAKCFQFDTGNVDTSTVTIENCEFQDQTVAHIGSSANSASTTYRVLNCKFYSYTTNSSFIGIDLKGGNLTLKSCWVTSAQTFIRNGDGTTGEGGVVYLDDMFGVPVYSGNGGCVWVNNTAELTMTNCRLGGEADAVCVVINPSVNVGVGNITRIENSALFSGDQPVVIFNCFPIIFRFKDNIASAAGWDKGFLFNSGSSATLGQIRGQTHSFIVDNSTESTAPVYQGETLAVSKTITVNRDYIGHAATLRVSDIVNSLQVGGGAWSTVLSNATATTGTDFFAAPSRTYGGSSASYNGQHTEIHGTVLTGQPTGLYTIHFVVENLSETITTLGFYAGGNEVLERLTRGLHHIYVPTYYNSGVDSPRAGTFSISLNNTQNVKVSRLRVYKGEVRPSTINTVAYNSASPSTLLWERGDRVINSAPTVGQPKSWVCTVTGVPGTWVSEGNL
jgi:hypothetical protein